MALLSTSGVVLLVCVLAGLYMVNRRMKPQGTVAIGAEKYAADVVEEPAEHISTSETAVSEQQDVAGVTSGSASFGLVPRWGRVAIFAFACGAVLLGLVTGIMSALGTGSFALPLVCLAVAVGSLTVLRVLAIRDRARRRARTALTVEKTRRVHRSSGVSEVVAPVASAPQPETSSIELRHLPERPARARQQMPVSHAAKALRKARTHSPASLPPQAVQPTVEQATETSPRLRMDEALPDTSWQVTEVPRPTYLDAPIAHREVPAVELPEAEKLSQTKTLAEAASLNLDDVLKRRRA